MKISLNQLLSRLPGAPNAHWPQGEPYAIGFEHGTMTLGFYAPAGRDPQGPHKRDEIYIIHSGNGELLIGAERHAFVPGDAFFVGAGVEHHFENFSEGFSAWVVFWGPAGGEAAART